MFDVRDYIKKLLLLVPAGCVVLAAGITISGYEVQQVKVKEKSIPQFQLVKEETESKTSPFDIMETVTLPEVETQTKEAVVLTKDTAEQERTYRDGTYYGSGTGFGGKLTVEVVIQDGKISFITLVENEGDDHPYIDHASTLLQSIVTTQSTNVDAVSGATYSSAGLIEAVRNALAQAVVSGTDSVVTADQKETQLDASQTSSGMTQLTGTETQGQIYRNGTYTGMAVCVPDAEEEFDAYTLTLNVTIANDRIVGISDIKGSGNRYITANDRYLAKAAGIAEKIIQSPTVRLMSSVVQPVLPMPFYRRFRMRWNRRKSYRPQRNRYSRKLYRCGQKLFQKKHRQQLHYPGTKRKERFIKMEFIPERHVVFRMKMRSLRNISCPCRSLWSMIKSSPFQM